MKACQSQKEDHNEFSVFALTTTMHARIISSISSIVEISHGLIDSSSITLPLFLHSAPVLPPPPTPRTRRTPYSYPRLPSLPRIPRKTVTPKVRKTSKKNSKLKNDRKRSDPSHPSRPFTPRNPNNKTKKSMNQKQFHHTKSNHKNLNSERIHQSLDPDE